MKKILSLLFLALLFNTSKVFCADGNIQKVYLNEAIQVALKNNIDLQAAEIDVNIAKNNIS